MSIASPIASDSLKGAIYQPPTERRDCCARCARSKVVGQAHAELWCYEHRARVSGGGICAVWAPVVRMVAA